MVILDRYSIAGFPKVKFEYTTQPEADNPNKIDVNYKIEEGAQVFVDKVLISGVDFHGRLWWSVKSKSAPATG